MAGVTRTQSFPVPVPDGHGGVKYFRAISGTGKMDDAFVCASSLEVMEALDRIEKAVIDNIRSTSELRQAHNSHAQEDKGRLQSIEDSLTSITKHMDQQDKRIDQIERTLQPIQQFRDELQRKIIKAVVVIILAASVGGSGVFHVIQNLVKP